MSSFEEQLKQQFADATGRKFEELVQEATENKIALIKKDLIKYVEDIGLKGNVFGCHDADFYGIPVLESGDELGFIDEDRRPGHAVWMSKLDAERVVNIIRSNTIKRKVRK